MVNNVQVQPNGDVLLTAEQAAEFLAVPSTWILAEARCGRLPHLRLGRYVRFQRRALEEWLLDHAHGPRLGTGA